jgi:hypothetical protein
LNPSSLFPTNNPITAPSQASTKLPTFSPTPTPSKPTSVVTASPSESPTSVVTASPTPGNSAQEITKDTTIPKVIVESIKSVASAENSTQTFAEKLIEDKSRIEKTTGESVAIFSSNLASINILKKEDSQNASTESTKNTRQSEFLAFEIRQLIDSNGNRILNLKDQPLKITGPEDSKRDGVNMQKFVASGLFNITSSTGVFLAQTSVDVIIELFSETGTVSYGKSSIRVFPGSVKFSYKISKWPFNSRTDKLYLAILSIASGNGGVFSEGSRLNVGDGFIETPFFAQADGNDVPIKVYFEKNSMNQASVLFEFPSYFSDLFYDPIASLSSNPYASEAKADLPWFSGANVIYVSTGAVVFVLGAVTLAVVVHRRKQKRNINSQLGTTKSTFLISNAKGKGKQTLPMIRL